MSIQAIGESGPKYDRQLLLLGAKRNAVLELWEVQRYGQDSYGDADYVAVYGMRPDTWYAQGIRLLGRTAVECTRDLLGDAIGRDVAAAAVATAARPPNTMSTLVIDPFAGSGNTFYWLLRHLPGARGLGFELDPGVFRLTQNNVGGLSLPIRILNVDYRSGLSGISLPAGQLLVAFIAPPWGDALDRTRGLDLRRTTPPIIEIVDFLDATFAGNRLLCAIQVYESIEPDSLAELKSRFDWSELRIYGFDAPGQNHGILLAAKGWTS